MNKKIFILLFFVIVLMSISAVSAADADDSNDTIVSSADEGSLALANDVDAIDDLDGNYSDGDTKALSSDAKSVAVGKNNEIYGIAYAEDEGDSMSPMIGDGYYNININFDSVYNPEFTFFICDVMGPDMPSGTLDLSIDNSYTGSFRVDNGMCSSEIHSLDAGDHTWYAEFIPDGGGEKSTEERSFTINQDFAHVYIDDPEQSSIEMGVGESRNFRGHVDGPESSEVNISSSNDNVAKFRASSSSSYGFEGYIDAVGAGTATITVSFAGNKNYKAAESKTLTVTVIVPSKTIYVNATANQGGDGNQTTPFQTLQDALDIAEDGDTIMIASGTYTGTNNTGLTINKNKLNFIKYGDDEAIFDAEGQGRIWSFMIMPANITGLTFKNGISTSSDGGGAIYMSGGNVINCNFIGNNATSTSNSDGGAIYCSFYTNVTNCTFTDNAASYMGGAIYFFREGSVSDCTFAGNTAKWGGAIRFDNMDNVDDAMTNCAFVNNSAQYGKVISSSGALKSVDNNWWGSNNPDWNELINQGGIPSSYAVLNVTTDKQSMVPGSKAKLNYAFYRNGTTEISSLPERAITLSATGGDLDDTSGYLVNGEFSTEFSADEVGEYEITAMVDNQEVKINVTVAIPTWYVNASKTSSGDGKSEEAAFMTLKEAIDAAGDGDIIMIAAGTYTGNNNTLLIINQNNLNLIKYGDGEAIFDAESVNRDNIFIFDTNDKPKSVNIKGLTFKNTDFYAITFNGQNAMCDSSINATFINIGNGKWGSAIFARHADNIDITGTFINNTAGEGLIKIFNDANNIEIHDSIFINNGESSIFNINGSSLIYNNWFGNTADDWNITPAGVDNAHIINWLFLNATADPNEIGLDNSSTITFDMYYLNFGSINKYDGPLDIQLNLTQTLGELDKTVASLGEEITYTAKDAGDASVTATFETASYAISLKNSGIPTELDLNLMVPTEYSEWDSVWITGYVLVNGTEEKVKKGSVDMYLNEEFIKTIEVDEEWGIDSDLGVLDTGNYTVKAIYHDESGEFMDSEWNSSFEIKQVITNITVNNVSIELIIDGCANIGAVLSPSEAGNLSYSSNDTEVVIVDENGDVTAVNVGTATITVSFGGNKNYAAAENKTVAVTVSFNDASVSVNNSTLDLFVGDYFTIVATTVPEGLNVTYIPDNSRVVSVDENGVVRALKKGTASIIVKVGGDGIYAENSTTVAVTVSLKDAYISADYDSEAYELVATLTNDEGKALTNANVVVTIDDVDYALKTNSRGQVKVSTENLTSGSYNVRVSYKGNSKYNPASETIEIFVKKSAVLTAPDVSVVYEDESGQFVATLTNDEGKALTGANVVVTLDGVDYALKTNSKGQVKVSTANLTIGTYTASVSYKGNAKYNPASATANVVVTKKDTIISVDYDSVAFEVAATLTNGEGKALNGANVVVTLDGVDYALKTNSRGQVKVSTADLESGYYNVTVSYKGNSKYNPASETAQIFVKKSAVINAPDVSVEFGDESGEFVATLTNDEGKALTGANVVVTLDGVDYALKTNSKGQIKVSTANLTIGTYTADVFYKGNAKYNPVTATATVAVTKKNAFISVIYDAEAQEVVATLINGEGKALNSANVVVALDGVDYALKTNSKGQVKVSTADFELGYYNVTASYKGNSKYKSASETVEIFVKKSVVLTAPDVYVEFDNESGEFVATLANDEGKALNGANLVVTLDGVDYALKTNSKGQVKVSLANMTIGDYAAVVSYKGNAKYAPATATATVHVTKKVVNISVDYDAESNQLVATLTNSEGKALNGANVVVSIDDVDYAMKTSSKGQAKVSTADLSSGTYTATVSYKGNSKYVPAVATSIIHI